MPIYEYRCTRCEHEFEAWQKITDEPIKVCPKCHARKVEKLISATSFQLKGSGWYATDYGRGSSGGGGKKPSGNGSGGSSPAAGGKESSGTATGGTKSDAGSSAKASAGTSAVAA
jgi:putative FmdB family regulatory protein